MITFKKTIETACTPCTSCNATPSPTISPSYNTSPPSVLSIDVYALDGTHNFLAESPFYNAESNMVYWIDILKGTIYGCHLKEKTIRRTRSFTSTASTVSTVSTASTVNTEVCEKIGSPRRTRAKRIKLKINSWDFKQRIGCAVPVQDCPDVLLVAALKGIGLFDLRLGDWTHYYGNPEHSRISNRWNDGKCAPDGSFWIGSMNHTNTAGSLAKGYRDGALYCLDGKSNKPRLRKQVDYVGISNGLAWSKDGQRMYYIDTPTQRVSEYIYEPKTSEQRTRLHLSRKDCIVIPPERGAPDGCAMDAEDNLWIAMWGGGRIDRYSTASGLLLLTIPLEDSLPTSLAWFGPDLDKLFATTAQGDSLAEILESTLASASSPISEKTSKKWAKNWILDFSRTNIRGLPVHSFKVPSFSDSDTESDPSDP